MRKWIRMLKKWLNGTTSTSEVLANFNHTIKRLKQVESDAIEEMIEQEKLIAEAQDKVSALATEKYKAKVVAEKLEKLINGF